MLYFLCRSFVELRGVEYSVSKIFVHASNNEPKFANDIAIVELDVADDGATNDVICIGDTTQGPMLAPFVSSRIAIVKRDGALPNFAKITESQATACSTRYQIFAGPGSGQFCAKVQSNASTSSDVIGIAAIDTDQDRQYTLAGFTSTSIRNEAATGNGLYVFTDTKFHLDWIKAAIGKDFFKQTPKHSPPANDIPTDNLNSCQMSGSEGFCVELHQCKLFHNESQPLSPNRQELLDRIKCSTSLQLSGNDVREDGVCCPEKHVDIGSLSLRFESKRGINALDMQKCGHVDPKKRIVGGARATFKEFPWIGLMKYKVNGKYFKYNCGSSLISNIYALTCAHCITNLRTGYEIEAVRFGEENITTDPDCSINDDGEQECNAPVQDIPVASILPHPKYNTPRYANDIGLVRLERAPDMSQGNY